MKMIRSQILLALLICFVALVLVSHSRAVSFSSVDLDLADPNSGDPNMPPNVFLTTVSAEVPVPGIGTLPVTTPEFTVIYIDPNMSGMQVDLDIDFSDPNAPVVNTIEFVGEPGDIEHVFPDGSVDFSPGFGVDVTVTPNGIKGFLTSNGEPSTVSSGEFSGMKNSLVARQGTVQVDTNIGFSLTEDLSESDPNDFTAPISGDSDNFISITKTGSSGATSFYDVTVTALLDGTTLEYDASGVPVILTISGILQGTGQIEFTIPEPASFALCNLALAMAGLRYRRRI